ncbi:hypothetical protein [Algoriphagus boritolerans]|uniref:hypothetical protein n=1 Tax=Algoriphagus boritolerans TaxID=308111 RepID=UPI000B0C28E0
MLFIWLVRGGCDPSFEFEKCEGEDQIVIEPIIIEGLNFEDCGFLDPTNDREYQVILKTIDGCEKYFNCSAISPIEDFNKYFILAGSYVHSQCVLLDN